MTAPVQTATTISGRRQWLALGLLLLPVLLVSIDNTVLNFALPSIAEDLRPNATTQLWMIDVYSLVLAALLVTMGSFGDRFGRRRLLLIGASGFAVVSAFAALSPTAEALVVARAALGFFGAMLMPSTLSLLRNIFPDPTRRRLAIAIWASTFTVGSTLGPIIGGALLQAFPWGSVFLIAVPILVPLLAFAHVLVPESKDPSPGPLDPVSVVLSLLGMLGIVWAIKEFAHDGITVLPALALIAGLALAVLFVRRQLKSENPLLDMKLFAYRPFTTSIIANLLSILGLIGFLFFVSQHLQLVLGLSPLIAGLVLLPGAALSVIAGIAVVRVAKLISVRTIMASGLALIAIGYLLILLWREDLTIAHTMIAFGLLEIGIGAAQTLSNDAIVSSVPPDRAGSASAISETAYELGAVLGTATLGTILTAFYRANVVLPDGLTAAQAVAAGETLGGATGVAQTLPTDAASALLQSARTAFESGVGVSAIVGAVLAIAAAVVVLRGFRTR